MKLESTSDLFFVLAVLVPGFIFSAVLSQLVPRRQAGEKQTLLLGYLTGTAFNYAIAGFPLYLIVTGSWLINQPFAEAIVWFATIFFVPIILAILVGAVIQNDWLGRGFRHLGLRWINMIPTGWDWKFSRTKPCFVLVTLHDGTLVAGYFGNASMASSDPDHRDLYLEKLYTIQYDKPWQPVASSDGIFIDGSQIAYIEFKEASI